MRHKPVLVLFVACMGMLSACTKAVIGPDLAHRPTPFVPNGTIELSDTYGVIQAEVTARPVGDTATVRFEDLGEKPYTATVTYHAFTPIIAESNTARKDYWLIGLNLTQTPDRSFYAVMRYPHGKALEPGTTRNDFEFRLLDCGDLAKPPEEDASDAVNEEVEKKILQGDAPPNLFAYRESNTFCTFERIEDVERHASRILRMDDVERRDAEAGLDTAALNRWSRLKVEAR
jgi:hypothetical protein